jgi:hypothetical protein
VIAAKVLALIALLSALVVLIAYAFEMRKRDAASARERAWVPGDLEDATLLLSEPKPIFAEVDGMRMVAKPDRAYRKPSGLVQLVELKTRAHHRVYDDDVIELSVQRAVLERAMEVPVESEGLVVTQLRGTDERRVHPVRLLSSHEATSLAQRYLAIIAGRINPRRTPHPGKCKKCEHASRCRPAA